MSRPDWPEYFLAIAKAVSARADCRRAQYGAVIVKDNRIISTGYNGSAPGEPSCLDGGCPRGRMGFEEMPSFLEGNHDFSNCISLHAEQNALARCREQGDTIYISGSRPAPPCDMCAKLIKAAGIERVVYE